MKKGLLIILMTVIGGASAFAQQNHFSFQYSMGLGTGDLGDFTNKYSFRGAQIEWRRYIDPTIAVGIDVGWNTFFEASPTETYTVGTASLTGKQYRYQNSFPMMAAGNYYFNPDQKLKPFVGLGLGTIYSVRDTQMYVYSVEQDAWHFGMAPQAGILYELGFATSLYLGLKYNVGFASGDFDAVQSYLAINVGFVFGE
jgi:outer membrane protein W